MHQFGYINLNLTWQILGSEARGARWVNHVYESGYGYRAVTYKKERKPLLGSELCPAFRKQFSKGRPLWRLYEARITLTQGNMVRGKEELFVTRKWVTQVWKVCESLRNPENCTVPSKTVQHWQTATLSQACLNLRTMSNHGRHGHGTCFTSLAAVVRRDIKFSSPLTTHRSGAKL